MTGASVRLYPQGADMYVDHLKIFMYMCVDDKKPKIGRIPLIGCGYEQLPYLEYAAETNVSAAPSHDRSFSDPDKVYGPVIGSSVRAVSAL